MRDLTIDQLLQIVGTERSQHTEQEIVAAEAELRRRSAPENELHVQKLHRAGNVCAFLGGVLFVWGTVGTVFAFVSVVGTSPPGGNETGFLFRHFNALFLSTALLEAVGGLSLCAGGLAIRKLRPSGRPLVIAPILAAMLWVVVFTVGWVLTMVTWLGKPQLISLVPAAFGILVAMFWIFVLNLPLRYFRSERVRQLLASSGAPN